MSSKPLLFLSYDIESDGPAPGIHSMISFGVAGFNEDAKVVFEYEAILKPLPDAKQHPDTMKFWSLHPEAWKYSTDPTKARDPAEVFKEFAAKILELKKKYILCAVAHPASFDWQYFNYYFYRFVGDNPLGHKSYCMNSYAWAMTHHPDPECAKGMQYWASRNPQDSHDHKPLTDARGQGYKFMGMWKENTHYLKELLTKTKH